MAAGDTERGRNSAYVVAIRILAVIILTSGIFYFGSLCQSNRFARDREDLAYYQKTYLHKSGYMEGYGNYLLRSFDGGKNWFAIDLERAKNHEVVILGPVEDIYSGLMAKIQGFDDLSTYVREHGPITLSGENAAQEKAILEKAGFTVTETVKP
ncbi:MAG: hypothetical protein WC242_03250 [Candidatus Paceibacterota bacterium]|jgi:hypothetical protein